MNKDTGKLYKVLYKINFLPILAAHAVRNKDGSFETINPDLCLMEMATEADE